VRQICAVSYVLMLDMLERQAVAIIQAAAMARALGAQVDVPSWFELREQFDDALAAEPKRVNTKDLVMLQAIGLRQ
jgi:hypothetical protein